MPSRETSVNSEAITPGLLLENFVLNVSVERHLESTEARALLGLVSDFADDRLASQVDRNESESIFPRNVVDELGSMGLMSLPFPEEVGGGAQPYTVYLQVLEELAARWVTVALAVSVHTLACHPVAAFGSREARSEFLPRMLSGSSLGAYCLSEAHAGSDPRAIQARAVTEGPSWKLNGSKAWVTHGGVADFYTVFMRTSDEGSSGLSCFFVTGDASGLSTGTLERKMGLTGSPTATMNFDNVTVDEANLIGGKGSGLPIALSALDAGRLGIAAIAVGLSQAALSHAVTYAHERETFGTPIINHQGLAFILADMEAQIEAARATYLHAANLKDQGKPYGRLASIAKLIATDTAMRVTTDAVQVLGGAGYTKDHPVERYMREAKIMQIFEGTNQIQRLVISRDIARRHKPRA